MSVVPIWCTGFEERSNDMLSYVSGGGPTSTYKNTGDWAWQIQWGQNGYKDLDSAYSQLRVGFFYYTMGWDQIPASKPLFRLFTAAGGTEVVEVGLPSVGVLQLEILGSQQDTWNHDLKTNEWIHFGVDAKINATTGWAKVYVNGVERLSFSGNTGSTNLQRLRWNGIYSTGAYDCGVDDVVVWSTTGEGAAACPTDIRLHPCFPNVQGSHNDGVGSDGNSTDNWALMDEAPPSDSDWVGVDAAAEKDTSDMESVSFDGSPTIPFVCVVARAKKTNATQATQFRLMTDDESNEEAGSDLTLNADFSYHQEFFEKQPDATDWNETDWNAMEVGFEGRGTF